MEATFKEQSLTAKAEMISRYFLSVEQRNARAGGVTSWSTSRQAQLVFLDPFDAGSCRWRCFARL